MESVGKYSWFQDFAGRESDCVLDVPVDALNGLSFQQMDVRFPIKMGGLGMINLDCNCNFVNEMAHIAAKLKI